MTLRVHLTTEAEPAEFHPAIPDGHRVFALQLALEVTEESEPDGKAAVAEFLGHLPEAQFLYVTTDDTGKVVTNPVERAFMPPLAQAESPPNIAAWLGDYLAGRNKALQEGLSLEAREHFQAPPFYADDDRRTADMRNARALDLMRAAWRWPAPLAQKAGLVSAAFVPGPVGEAGFLVFVPKGATELTVSAPEVDYRDETDSTHNLYRITVSWKGAEKPCEFTYEFVTRNLADDMLHLPSKRFEVDGHYVLPANPEGLQRLLSRIEERAPFLLWAPTVMGTHAAAKPDTFRIKSDSNDSLFSGEKLHWLARVSALSMFDTTIVGLLLPVSNSSEAVSSRSPVLERLTRTIAGSIEQDPSKDVDESALYLALHKALWAGFADMDRGAIWESIHDLVGGTELPTVKEALTGGAPDNMDKAKWQAELQALSGELGQLAELLESEAGGESWLKARLQDFIAPSTAHCAYDTVAGESDLERCFKDFLDSIDSDWNASAALRNAFGAQAMLAATKRFSGTRPEAIVSARNAVTESAPLLQRFGLGDGSRLFDALWGPVFPDTAPDGLRDFMIDALRPNLEVLARDPENREVFRPDDRPLPLQLPIADSPDAFGQAGWTEFMSGLGFLIHHGPAGKSGAYDGEPVHLNLIRLIPHDTMNSRVVERTVDPVLPQPAPGCAGIAIPYTGAPLSSPGLAAPGTGGQSEALAALAARLADLRPYRRDEVDYGEDDRLPDLAYGFGYRHSAFWVPPSGVLPVALRDTGNPFFPVRPKTPPYKHSDTPWLCQRRTAIAGAGLAIEPTDPVTPYAVPPEVHPLSLDVPRIAVPKLAGGRVTRDLYRSTGGAGSLGPDKTKVILRDVVVPDPHVFTVDQLHVVAMTGSKPEEATEAKISHDPSQRTLTVEVEIKPAAEGEVDAKPQFFWLRLSFTDNAHAQVLIFADPQADMGQDASARSAPPLLIAPDATDKWLLPDQQTVRVTGPRVAFEDLERWAANRELWGSTCDLDSKTAQDLITTLRVARALFEATDDRDAETGERYADRLKALPDPAVTGLMLMMAQTDAAQSIVSPAVRTHTLLHRPYANHGDQVATAKTIIDNLTKKGVPEEERLNALDDLQKVCRALTDAILKQARYSLQVAPGTQLSVDAHSVQVAEGRIAQLSVHPLVPRARFNTAEEGNPLTGVFHPRMAELSIGNLDDKLVFAGPALAIEVMTTPNSLDDTLLHATLSGRSRAYGIEAYLPDHLRLFSQADLVTQRWRFTRPIYSWIDVAGPVDEKYPSGPVVPVGETQASGDTARGRDPGQKALEAFEKEAFATRDHTDGAYTRVRLRPPGETTALDRIAWPERSATYLRHRIELLSRYAGAMRQPHDARVARKINGQIAWDARLAILAEPDAAPLGRPQIRAFLPLQRRVTRSDPAGPTPITCILSEPPYAQLGLADRIDAELAVKPRFKVPENGTLQVEDLRKELSPDPLLSYFPVRPGVSRSAVLETEGPAGLHFDRAQSAAPAWSNAQYLLRISGALGDGDPDEGPSANAEELEESFAGVILSRRADPRWSWYAPESHADTGTLRPRWVKLVNDLSLIDATGNVATVTKEQDGNVTVTVRRSAIFDETDKVPVTLWSGRPADALLITPLGDRRYRLGIYGEQGADTNKGTIGGARLLTGLTIFTDGTPLAIKQPEGAPPPRPACQSPTTLTDWVRSTRDFLHVMQGGAGKVAEPKLVEDLVAQLTEGRLHFNDGSDPARITTPLALRPYALHVHRRLVSILRRPSEQIGARIDLFHGAWLADDWGVVNQSTKETTAGMRLTLGELETRAECVLLSGQLPPQPPADEDSDYDPELRYQEAIFDLVSTSANTGTIRQLRFHIRSAGDPLPLDKLKLAPHWPGAELMQAGDAGCQAHALDAILFPDPEEEGKTKMRISGRDIQGNTFEAEHSYAIPFVELVHKTRQVRLCLILAESDERWADVSLLHSRYDFDPTDLDRLDFDWIFGVDASADTQLPRAISPEVLNRLPEAQARLVGLTDPIDVTLC